MLSVVLSLGMRRALAVFLFLTLCHQLVLKLGIIAWYQYNKDYIASNLCENRDKPAMKCCGKCVLNKKLAKAEKENSPVKPLAEQLSKGKVSPFIVPDAICMAERFDKKAATIYHYRAPVAEEIMLPVFHPPG